MAAILEEKVVLEEARKARELIESIEIPVNLKDGLSFLDLKNDTFLSYMIDSCNILLRKARNESIGGHKSIERTVEYRVTLEKIKGIDQRLNYQINRLLTQNVDNDDDKMNLNNFDIDEKEESELYRPRKLRAVGPKDDRAKVITKKIDYGLDEDDDDGEELEDDNDDEDKDEEEDSDDD